MLSILRIKNLALVSDLTLSLQPGYNAVTGETGAGKSIIIGALNLVLGERADRTLIRTGSDSCSVEAVFEVSKGRDFKKILEENGLEGCADGQLILKRVFTAAGANRQFINGSPTTLQVLAALGQELVDMHGPHEHQSLLHPAKQLDILDAYAGAGALREKFSGIVSKCRTLEEEKAGLIVDERTYAAQLDLLRFQVKEISQAKLKPEEEAVVEQEFQRASNAARLLELSQTALNILSESETALLTQAGELGKTLQALQKIDAGASEALTNHDQAAEALHEVQTALRRYVDAIEVDPEHLHEVEERLNLIHSLKRKYGGAVADVVAFGDEAAQKLESLEQRDAELSRINTALKKLQKEMEAVGAELTALRKKAIPKLAKAAMKQLQDLGFQQSQFGVAMWSTAAHAASGFDQVEFQFAPNPGEQGRSLRAIASSGEMSRVMLALKTVLAGEDEIPLLVFDEVDANVGGETAGVVGEKMLQIARQHQVICITHLAPVAASATSHFMVTKRAVEGRTVSEITLLGQSERVKEIARMLGGQSAASLKHAEELLRGK